MPLTVGVPVILIVSADQLAVTPVGKPVTVPIPVADVVICVISANIVLTHRVGVEDGVDTELAGVMVIFPEAFTLPQPPDKGIR